MATRSLGQLTLDLIAKIGGFEQGMSQAARIAETRSRQIERSLKSVNKGLDSISSSVRSVRSLFAGFGVALSGRAFANWISRSLDAARATGVQAKEFEEAQGQLKELRESYIALGQTIGTVLLPVLREATDVAKTFRKAITPTASEVSASDLRELFSVQKQISEFESTHRVVGRDAAGSPRFRVEEQADFNNLLKRETELQKKLGPEIEAALKEKGEEAATAFAKGFKSGIKTLDINDIAGSLGVRRAPQIELEPLIEEQAWDQFRKDFKTMSENLPLTPDIGPFLEMTSEQFRDELTDMNKDVESFAHSLGRGLHDSFVDFLVDGEANFKDFLKRLAIEVATSELFGAIGGALGNSTSGVGQFFSKLFGGSRAMGGDVAAGKVYQVHPNEAFFEPGRSGFVATANGGVHIEIGQINADDAIGVRRAVAEGVMVAIKQAARNTADMIDKEYRTQMA